MESKNIFILYCEHSLLSGVRGDLTDIICTAVNSVINGQALGAQKMRSLWAIGVRSNEARETLSQSGIMVNDMRIPLHINNPYTAQRVEGERVIIKDLPFWEDDAILSDFFRAHPNVGQFSKIYRSTTRNTKFFNGDRYVYMKLNPDANPPISPRIRVGEYLCRVQYSSMNMVCERCKSRGHHTKDTGKCPAYVDQQPGVHFFSSGILSNFEECPLQFEELDFRSSEQAYQWSACVEALRDDLAEEVMKSTTPREAKNIASAIKTPDSNWHDLKFGVMERVLQAKLKSNKAFRDELLATGNKIIIEARQDLWWGSGMSFRMSTTTKPQYHPGQSWLGEILMKLRSNLQSENTSKIPEVSTTAVDTQINSSRSNSPRQSRPPTRRGRLVSSSIGPKGSTNNTSDLKIRSTSNSPSRNTPLKGVKFDTPLLTDFLRRQVKETRSQTDSSIQTPSCDDFSDNTHL